MSHKAKLPAAYADLRSGDPERESRAREWIDADVKETVERTKSFIEAMQALYKQVRERN